MSVEILYYITFRDRIQLWNTSSQWRRYIKIYTKRHYKDLLGECVVILDPSKHDKSGAKKYHAVIVQVDVDNDRFKVHYTSHLLKNEDIPQNKWIDFHGGYLSQWIFLFLWKSRYFM